MRIWILSDLHRNVGRPWLPPAIPDANVAVIAGDVGEGLVESIAWIGDAIRPHMEAVLVAGNHEFYRRRFEAELASGRRAARNSGIHFLENDTAVVEGVAFTGCTLWTDYELDGPNRRAASMDDARRGMNDHRLISTATSGEPRPFRPEDALGVHLGSRRYLERELARSVGVDGRSCPSVVVTHHAPSARCIAPRYRGASLNPSFSSRLDPLIERFQPALWVHGHTHTSMDFRIGGTRVLCNPKGYPGENAAFDPGLVVEV
ncbi:MULTISPECIES: metallophosphoesterase [unclassified Methylobacterium]|jgi:predicted phosphodiesterase|uniref:metallophosphoesterase n=1 Tax=unclassified Methylobacterium TaxID=2615210 RepID=UPI0006F82885|nr:MULTISPECIES: metallophosphoesterase [unclassified Methylobacterium]KQO59650.1 metallophosphoesterase [Methylobacterium sp. Leaf87]KQP60940.1 metallophosphoesterase [Methylobacterium sp. Leaf112]